MSDIADDRKPAKVGVASRPSFYEIAASLTVELGHERVILHCFEGFDFAVNLFEMFLCPLLPKEHLAQ
jgi:hypothetical protein